MTALAAPAAAEDRDRGRGRRDGVGSEPDVKGAQADGAETKGDSGGAAVAGNEDVEAARCLATGTPCRGKACKRCCGKTSLPAGSGSRLCWCKGMGKPCRGKTQCCSGRCIGGKCAGAIKAAGRRCAKGDTCPSGATCRAYATAGAPAGTWCLLPGGASCTAPGECAANRCEGGRCGEAGGESPCTVAPSDGAVTHATAANFEGKPLRLEQTVQRFGPEGAAAGQTALTLAGAPLLTMAFEGAGGAVTVTVTYGDAFRGIKQARFTNDGSTVQGEIDGRAIEPLPANADPQQARFADGGPPPGVRVDPDLAEAIRSLMRQAEDEAASPRCNPDAPAAAAERRGRAAGRNPTQSLECLALYIPCQIGYVSCMYGAAAGCAAALFGYGICVAIGLGVCLLAGERCRRGIRHNAPCCPVRCGGASENSLFGEDPGCCEGGQTCLNA